MSASGKKIIPEVGDSVDSHHNSEPNNATTKNVSAISLAPLNLAFWLSATSGIATSTDGEKVVLRTLFPRYERLGQLIPGTDIYTVMAGVDVRGELCFKPVRFNLLHLLDEHKNEGRLLVVEEVRAEREFIRRRQHLLSLFAGAGWHYAANLATAGLGYLSFLERHFDSNEAQKVVGGIDKALRGVKECTYLVCAMARNHDGSRQIELKEAIELLSRFCKGIFAPDLVVETSRMADCGAYGHSRALVSEAPLFHLILELILVVYQQGARKIDFRMVSPQEVIIDLEISIAVSEECGFSVALNLGAAYGIQISVPKKNGIRCVVREY